MTRFRTALALSLQLWAFTSLSQVSTPYKLFFEKTYLHTDRETYAGGEDLWFKAYLVNPQNGMLTPTSNNLYVELISPDAKIAGRKVIRLENGLGNGDFHLPDSIPAGEYRLRAYTSWMRNFGDAFIFEKNIRIPGESAEVKAQSGELKAPGPAIRFFPEGGSLIEGVPAIVAFRAEDGAGNGIPVNGNILSPSGEILTGIICDSTGAGSFFLDGAKGTGYSASVIVAGKTLTAPLPPALAQGFSLFVRSTDSLFKVTISTNAATFAFQQGKPLVLLAKNKGKIVFTAQFVLKDLQAVVNVVKETLPPGLSAFTLYDSSGKPQCERLVYTEGAEKDQLLVAADKANYTPKGKVTVNLKTLDQYQQPVKASLSLTAVDAGLVPVNAQNIVAYLNLTSELKGEINHPDQYFDPANPNRRQQLDLLLLTQGWRDFLWKRVADSIAKPGYKVSYPLEQGLTVSGKVRESGKDKPLAGANITLFAPAAKGNRIFSAVTDSTGHYFFDGIGLYGSQTVRLNSRDNKGQKYGRIALDSLFKEPPVIARSRPAIVATTPEILQKTVDLFTDRAKAVRKINLADTIGLKAVEIKADRKIHLIDQTLIPWGEDEVFNIDPKDYDHRDLYHYLQHYSRAYVDDVEFVKDSQTGDFRNTWDEEVRMRPAPPGESPHRSQYEGANLLETFRLLFYRASGIPVFPRLVINGKEFSYTDEGRDIDLMVTYQHTYLSMEVSKVKKVVIKHGIGGPRIPISSPPTNAFHHEVLTTPTLSDVYVLDITFKDGALDQVIPDIVSAKMTGYYEARTFFKPVYENPSAKTDLRATIHWEPNITTNEKGEATLSWYNADPKTKIRIVAEGITEKGIPVSGTTMYSVK